jgi:sugar-specific transcriptional regulator TrmB
MKKFSFVIIGILFSANIYSQNNAKYLVQDSSKLYNRIDKIEQFQENTLGKIENKSSELDNKFTKLEQDLKNDNNYMKTLLWIFGSITVLGLIVGLYSVYKNAIKFANQKIEEKLDKFFEDKKHQFIDLIRKNETETFLKQNKKILLLSGEQSENERIIKQFKKFDFTNVKNTVIAEFENIKSNSLLKESDVIVINNKSKVISDENLDKLLKSFTDFRNSFIYYGTFNNQLSGMENVNFANSEFTLYARIIETIKAQQFLVKN